MEEQVVSLNLPFLYQILLQDSINLRGEHALMEEQVLEGCIMKVRAIRHGYYADVPVVVGVESAPKRTPIRLEYALRNTWGPDQVCHMKEVEAGKAYGLPKTEKTTGNMVFLMRHQITNRGVRFSADYCTYRSDTRVIRSMFEEQLRAYKFEVDPNTKKGKYTGKVAGRNDDLIISALMAPYWSSRFKMNARYSHYVRARGMRAR